MKITIKAETTIKRLGIWNGIFNLTKKELEVISALVDAEAISNTGNVAAVENKKVAAQTVGIEDYNTLNNYIKRLKDKKALILKGNIYILHTLLRENTKYVEISIV